MDLDVMLPGEAVRGIDLLSSKTIHCTSGLHKESSTAPLSSTFAGILNQDPRKKTAYIAAPNARYVPRAGDLVIAQVQRSSMDFFHLSLCPHTAQAILPQLAFEGASKKTRPQLKVNDLVYARVLYAHTNMEVELTCINPSTGKSEPEGLGPINGGMVFDVSVGFSAHLLESKHVIALEELGEKIAGGFEIAVGRNGKVWVDCPEFGLKGICAIGRLIYQLDGGDLGESDQQKLVKKLISEMGLG